MLTMVLVFLDKGELSHAYRLDTTFADGTATLTRVTEAEMLIEIGCPLVMVGREESHTLVFVDTLTEEYLSAPIF